MRTYLLILVAVVGLAAPMTAASKPHVVSFGKWTTVKWQAGDGKALEIKVRALFVDVRLKEYTIGLPHDVTDRLFVVRRERTG
jgi:hypothetical protein